MDKEQWQEAYELEIAARALLRAKQSHPGLMLIRLPSFADCASLSIIADGRAEAMRLLYLRWDRERDMAKLAAPVERLRWPRVIEPTVQSTTTEIARNVFDRLLRELASIRVTAAVIENMAGLDGCSYEVHWNGIMNFGRFGWWENGPDGWHELASWFNRTWDVLHTIATNGDAGAAHPCSPR